LADWHRAGLRGEKIGSRVGALLIRVVTVTAGFRTLNEGDTSMALPASISWYLDSLRADIRMATPYVQGAFDPNRDAHLQNVLGVVERTPSIDAAAASLQAALNTVVIALNSDTPKGDEVRLAQLEALSRLTDLEAFLSGARPNAKAVAMGRGW
jgi:hypothetical protein